MAGNVKGITIEFRGETTKLDKALKDVNRESRSITKELNNVNKAIKFNPTSVELWRQKQDLLKKKISETSDKLQLLKEKQKNMDATGVDKNSAEYQKLRREIIETESQLKHFKGELDKTGNAKLTALGNQFKQVGDKMKEAGKTLTQYVTLPIAALGGASIKAFKDVDAGMDIVVQKTGATGKELDGMKETVKNIAGEVPSDFQTIGTAVGEVNTRFGLTGTELESLSTKFLQFAKINNTDVNTSVDRTQKALAAFGMDAKEAGPLLDQLNTVGQKTGVDMNLLLNGLVQNSAAFQEMGLSAEQSATLMGQLEVSGANSTTVMAGLRKALKTATQDGTPLNEALANLQTTITQGKGGVDGLTAAYELFGKSGDQVFNAVKNGSLDFTMLGTAVAESGNSVQNTFNETLDPATKFQTSLQQLQVVGYDVGSTLLDLLTPALEKVGTFLTNLKEKWEGLSPEAQKAILIAAGIVAAVGPVLTILGSLATSIGSLMIFGPMIVSAIGGVVAAFGPVIAIVAAVIAVGVLLYKNWDKIKAVAKQLWTNIKTAFNGIKTAIQSALMAALKVVADVWKNIKAKILVTVNNIKTTVSNVFTSIKTSISNIFTSIKTTATNVWNKIKESITKPIEKAKDKVKDIIDKIKGFFKFTVSLPHIKLPHFSISPSGWKIGDLLKGSIPKLSINWYAQGGIFDGPTIAGIGEAGPEAVVPLDKFWKKLEKMGEGGSPQITINVYGTDNMNVSDLAKEVEKRLIDATNRRRLAW